MGKYFYLIDKPGSEDYSILQINLPNYRIEKGSYNVLPARVLNMNFLDYVDFCKNSLGAIVNYGNNKYYPAIYFPKNSRVQTFIEVLNDLIKNSINE